MIKLAQLSDLHLLADPSEQRWELQPQALFDQTLALALQQQPDAILLTGDLVHDESDSGYQRLLDRVSATDLPVLAIPGNHDNPDKIQHYFGDALLQLSSELTVIGLNTHIKGSDCGFLGDEEIQRADSLIKASKGPVLLALHHHPVHIGSAWIDELSLVDNEVFNDLLRQHTNQLLGVVCGHIHQVFETTIHGIPLLSCPSTNRQFLPSAKTFATDTLRPGLRILEVEGGQLTSQVLRLP